MPFHSFRPSIQLFAAAAICACAAVPSMAASTIYRCESSGVITFSDRPCSTAAVKYVPDEQRVSTVKVEPASGPSPVRSVTRSKARAPDGNSIAAEQLKLKGECARVDRSLREIRSKMRAGYDAREGERLRSRQSKLMRDRREKKCR